MVDSYDERLLFLDFSVEDDKLKPTHTCLHTDVNMSDDLVKLIKKLTHLLFDVYSSNILHMKYHIIKCWFVLCQ